MKNENGNQERYEEDCDDAGNSENQNWKRDIKIAMGAGIAVIALIILGSLIIGFYGGADARRYVETMLSTSRILCSGVMTATATILALMLTMLGLSLKSATEMEDIHYKRIQRIAFHDMLLLSLATIWLMLLCIPVQESSEVPELWYPVLYYVLLGVAAILGGGLVSIVVMLYTTISELIQKVCFG